MKRCIFLITILSFYSSLAQPDLKKLDWLNGAWARTNAKAGRSGVEIWQKISDSEMIGRGVSLRGTDTSFVEKLKIVVKDNAIFYVADVPENKEPVLFKLTEQTENKLVFENLQHDFPKKISYELIENKLKAIISGNGKEIEYWYRRE